MFQPGVFLCDERSGYKPMGSGLKQDGPESWNKTRIAEWYLMVVAHVDILKSLVYMCTAAD